MSLCPEYRQPWRGTAEPGCWTKGQSWVEHLEVAIVHHPFENECQVDTFRTLPGSCLVMWSALGIPGSMGQRNLSTSCRPDPSEWGRSSFLTQL